MSMSFHKDMNKYLSIRRRKRLFSGIKSKLMNQKAAVSYKAANKFGELKGKLASRVEEIKRKKEESEREITQTDIDELVEKKGVNRPLEKKTDVAGEGEGWKEIKLENLEKKDRDFTDLEEKKMRIQEGLVKIQEKEKEEKWKIVKLSEENEQREKTESEKERVKRIELEEEVRILKEKQKIEEGRLAELRTARRREQMEALRGRVSDILFKKRPKIDKNMAEELRKEIRMEAKIGEAERQRAETKEKEKPKEDVAKVEEMPKKQKKEIAEEIKEEKKEVRGAEGQDEQKPKKSFFSNFIQIRTAAEIAREEGERARKEEEQALKDQSEISKVFQEEGVEVRTNMPKNEPEIDMSTLFQEEQGMGQEQEQEQMQDSDRVFVAEEESDISTLFPGQEEPEQKQVQGSDDVNTPAEEQEIDMSTLFPGSQKAEQKQVQGSDNVIELDHGYRIKVVRNE